MLKKLVIIEPINMLDTHLNMLNSYAKEIVYYKDIPTDDEQIIKRIDDADAVLLSYTSKINRYVIEHCPNIKYIGMCCSLYSKESANVDIDFASEKNIIVKGIRDYGDEGVIEYIIHELVEFLEGYKVLKWDTYPHEISSLKCGVVGLGTSGTLIAQALKLFKADVSYYSRTRKPDAEERLNIKYQDLNSLCQQCDAIFLALNKNVLLLDKEQFALMNGKKILFNTSIGPGFKQEPFEEWLKKENHYFFGDTLPTIGNTKLWELENTYTINRSSGGKSYEAFYRLGQKVIDNIKNFLEK